MKTKILALLVGAAVITLSFTLTVPNESSKKIAPTKPSSKSIDEPVGGFLSEDVH